MPRFQRDVCSSFMIRSRGPTIVSKFKSRYAMRTETFALLRRLGYIVLWSCLRGAAASARRARFDGLISALPLSAFE